MNNKKKLQKENLNKFLLVSKRYKSEENLKKIDRIKEIITELKIRLSDEVIDKIMGTHKDFIFGKRFFEFLDLHRRIKPKLIAERLKVSYHLIASWYRSYPPRPIRTLLNIYFNQYHKINKKDLAYLFGWGFGDGGISYEFSYYFVCGNRQDLLTIKSYLNGINNNFQIIIQENNGKSSIQQVNGKIKKVCGKDSWIFYIRDSSFCKLLYALGLPKGNKVLQKTNIPNWIKKGNKEIKKAFLNAIFEGELQKHRVVYNVKRKKIDICPISFGLSKRSDYKSNLIDFLNQIKQILYELNIKSTKVEEPKPSNIRKDGVITYSSRFYISISAINTMNFSKVINYPFNKEKKEALRIAVTEARNKLRRMKKQIEKYKKALKLFDEGISIYRIAKELKIEYNTARHWLKTKKHLPILLNQESGGIFE